MVCPVRSWSVPVTSWWRVRAPAVATSLAHPSARVAMSSVLTVHCSPYNAARPQSSPSPIVTDIGSVVTVNWDIHT